MIFDAVASHISKILSMERFKSHIKNEPSSATTASETSFARHDTGFSDSDPIPTLEQATLCLVAEAMKRSGNNQTMAAGFLGISRQRLGRYLKNISS